MKLFKGSSKNSKYASLRGRNDRSNLSDKGKDCFVPRNDGLIFGTALNPLAAGIISIMLIMVLTACKEEIIIIPDTVFSKDTMAAILTDIQLEEAIISKLGLNDSLPKDSILIQYALIFKKHKISQEEFEKSYNFYKENPKMLEEIYEKVITRLSEMQALLGNINISKIDSLKKIKQPETVAKDLKKNKNSRMKKF